MKNEIKNLIYKHFEPKDVGMGIINCIHEDKDVDKLAESLVDLFSIPVVSNWVAIESDEKPKRFTEVMVKYTNGITAIAVFDGDGRFYIEKDDRDITDIVFEWHNLP